MKSLKNNKNKPSKITIIIAIYLIALIPLSKLINHEQPVLMWLITLFFLEVSSIIIILSFKELFNQIKTLNTNTKYAENVLNHSNLTEVELIQAYNYNEFFENLKNIATFYAILKENTDYATIYLKFENEHDLRFFQDVKKCYFTDHYKVKDSKYNI